MSLRSDVMFVTSLIGSAIRQILGETFRSLADYLLREDRKAEPAAKAEASPPTPAPTPPRRVRGPYNKTRARLEVIGNDPPPEVVEPEKPVKVRDRSTYKPKEHNGYKRAAVASLRLLLEEGARLSAPAIHKVFKNVTDSTIRTACKIMVEDGLLDTVLDESVNSNVYWVINREAAKQHLAELEPLVTLDEPGEPESSLD